MPRRRRTRSSEELKAEDFVDSVLNFGGEEEDGEEEKQEAGGDGQPAAEFKSKNLEAERKRRGKLNRNILALRAVVPNITKVLYCIVLDRSVTHGHAPLMCVWWSR